MKGKKADTRKLSDKSKLHRLINRERERRGLCRLKWDRGLYHNVSTHNLILSHGNKLFHSNIHGSVICECCALVHNNQNLPEAFLKNWMNSPKHKILLLHPDIACAAVDIKKSKYGFYATWQGGEIEF